MRSRYRIAAITAISLLYFVGTLSIAATKPLWYDELLTVYVAGQRDVGGVWNALKDGVDLNPPLYPVMVHLAAKVLGHGALATRVPSTVGFLAMMAGVFGFLRARLPLAAATVGALIPVLSGIGLYAFEGRGYGVMLGFVAVAAFCWQRTSIEFRERRLIALIGLAVALAGALSTHYYAVLVLGPLAAAQAVHDIGRRRIDHAVWGALAGPLLVFLAWIPLMRAGMDWRPGFWAQPVPGQIGGFYQNALAPLAIPLATALMAFAIAARFTIAREPARPHPFPAHELVFATALMMLPILGWTCARLATGAWTDRYGVSAIIGIGILIAIAVDACGRRAAQVICIVLLALFGAKELNSATLLLRDVRPPAVLIPDDDGVSPIVVSRALVYLPVWHYAPEPIRARLVYLVADGRPMSGALGLKRLATVTPIHVQSAAAFTSANDRFYLCGSASGLTAHPGERTSVVTPIRIEMATSPTPCAP